MLQRKATDAFVNVMNELHDSQDPVRMRVSDPLNSQEIYYLLVTTEEVIYTSTYTKLYDRMMTRFSGKRGDSLLMSIHFDRFKKFIKMAANYNRLDDFLKSMPELRSNQLMYAFVNNLEKTNSLEDAVDVADSYGSITNVPLLNFLKEQVKVNLEKNQKIRDRRGEVIYNILYTLFRSAADTSINLSSLLGIPPVYKVDYNSIQDSNGAVVQHVFFYGDEDGKTSYANFMGLFRGRSEWKITENNEWVTIASTSGKSYTIYANKPLDYKQDLDAQAQQHLIEHLTKNKINPTFVVHRGHSYHLKYTIQQMLPSSRIVMLGSCGGYQNLAKILNVNDDAHIISTKQVGSYSVNEPILRALNEAIRNGKNIEWIPLWQQITASVKADARATELLKDYVPPHKNLGAIFIKAYRKATGEM
jgi:predicted phosphatase